MYCSNRHFLQVVEEVGIKYKEFYDLLIVIFALNKKYGSLLKSFSLQKIIFDIYPEISQLIILLHSVGKLHTKNIREMLDILGRQIHVSSFSIISSLGGNIFEKIEESLHKRFKNIQVITQKNNNIELQVTGNGWYYKRGLERDLDKILK